MSRAVRRNADATLRRIDAIRRVLSAPARIGEPAAGGTRAIRAGQDKLRKPGTDSLHYDITVLASIKGAIGQEIVTFRHVTRVFLG